jgi:hypothetical protein
MTGETLAADGPAAAKLPISERDVEAAAQAGTQVRAETPASEEKKSGEHRAAEFTSLSAGDKYDGGVIDFIHGASDSFIVYESQGRLMYDLTHDVLHRALAMDAANDVMAVAEVQLEGAYAVRLKKLMGTALVRAFSARVPEDVQTAFTIVRAFIGAHGPVQRVFGRSREFVVFMDQSGRLMWDYPKLPNAMLPVIAEFERLNQVATNALSPTDDAALRQILGHELAIAFRTGDGVAIPSEVFSASREFISKRMEAAVSNHYVTASLCVAAILGVLLCVAIALPFTWLVSDARILAFGGLAGMIGACISVLQRSSTLGVTHFAPRSQVVTQAVVRMALGIVFGVIVVVAVRGDVAFGTFKSQTRALFLLAVVAGFSERFIPDFLGTLGTSAGESTRRSNPPR